MRKRGIVEAVVDEMRQRNIDVSYDVAELILNLSLEVIKQETSRGATVHIDNFGRFRPMLVRDGSSFFWRVKLHRCEAWKRATRAGANKEQPWKNTE